MQILIKRFADAHKRAHSVLTLHLCISVLKQSRLAPLSRTPEINTQCSHAPSQTVSQTHGRDRPGLTQHPVLYRELKAFENITTVRTLITLATVSRAVNMVAARLETCTAFQEAAMETDGQQECLIH